jgi:membrane associated rhomboid family serine protease
MSDPTVPTQQQTPVCPRHPDRVAYVRCQRCSRPVCPECQRPAAVGVQCVDCVRQQAATVRQPTTVFGGRVSDRPRVTMAIIVACVLVFLAQRSVPGLTSDIAFVPYLGETEPWRFLTSAFAHGGTTHILFNMLALWMVGQYLERLLGGLRFAALYLVSALGGGICYLLLATPPDFASGQGGVGGNWFTGAVGASGAVFGLFGALIVLNRRLGLSNAGIWATIGINAVIGFLPGLNIAWEAHLGGLVTGAATAGLIAWLSGHDRRRYQWVALAGVVAVLVAAAAVKYATAVDIVVG